MTDSIGVFGLGLIGQALAHRLLQAGHSVAGFDPNPDRMADLEQAGGLPAQEADIWASKTVLAAVFDTDQLLSVIRSAPAGSDVTLVATSTCDPDRMLELEEEAARYGIRLLEAPLSGTSKDLANGNAVFLVGGSESLADANTWLFSLLGRAHYYVGGLGNGNRAKLAINLVLGLNRAALAEGLVFAKALGLQPNDFLELARNSAAYSAVMETKGPLMTARDFKPLGRITQSAKDFKLIRTLAGNAEQGLPFAETYSAMVDDCIAEGEGDIDNSAILLAIERVKFQGD
ncbi:NAD(P)-dependent oxidoreductase [Roseibium sp.]|uniref:NAD(P)-dependent oxidoreductase n=2 Tax=Pseudomonadota TaxID=1224 RepID=UPI0032635C8A